MRSSRAQGANAHLLSVLWLYYVSLCSAGHRFEKSCQEVARANGICEPPYRAEVVRVLDRQTQIERACWLLLNGSVGRLIADEAHWDGREFHGWRLAYPGPGEQMERWTPEDIERISADVAALPGVQQELLEHASLSLKVADRVAHQYQIAGGRVSLRIPSELPSEFDGIGLFKANAEYTGIGRVSTGLGCPHIETNPDFLGLRLAFLSDGGQRVDFIGINHPAAPTDTHLEFMALLAATADAAGRGLLASEAALGVSLIRNLGAVRGAQIAAHVTRQTARTALSSTAYQTYWTGVVEMQGCLGKCVISPTADVNTHRALTAGAHHLTADWRDRQSGGPIQFDLYWIPFIDAQSTPLIQLTRPWQENRYRIGQVAFPRADLESEEALLWAALAAEMGANPGNWVRDRANSIVLPETEFGLARKIAYEMSQEGRGGPAGGRVHGSVFTRRDQRRAGRGAQAPP